MQYRLAENTDSTLLASMNQQLIQDENHRNPMSFAELDERMAGWLAGDYQAILFEQAGAVYGYVLFREQPEYIYLRQFYIQKEHRRAGKGRAAMEWLRQQDWPSNRRLRLEVLVENSAGLAFWKSVGFHEYSVTLETEHQAEKQSATVFVTP